MCFLRLCRVIVLNLVVPRAVNLAHSRVDLETAAILTRVGIEQLSILKFCYLAYSLRKVNIGSWPNLNENENSYLLVASFK